ncbi:hypothetical protein V5O48_011793 [Marasmius crinis-equi]|uniref:F-box domain-containing protein n=1 Tax=Marasmius crinis-equi TaxID=585013 RepID=A0ABR3F4N2_9AGAR
MAGAIASVGLHSNGRKELLKAEVDKLRRLWVSLFSGILWDDDDDLDGALQPSKPGPSKVLLSEDLLQHIFDELDDESVRQCALASRLFLKSARSRLFQRVVLRGKQDVVSRPSRLGRLQKKLASIRNRPTKAEQLAALLTASPKLGEFVKELIFEGQPYTTYLWYLPVQLPFHDILPRLPNLQSLSFLFHQHYALFFGSIPAPSRTAIIQALHSPKIRQVVVENVLFGSNDDLSLFLRHATAGGGLERLSISAFNSNQMQQSRLYRNWWDDTPAPLLPELNPKNALRTLQVNGPPAVVEQILVWATSDESVFDLTFLFKFEVVGAITSAQLNLVAQISQRSRHLCHLGITSGEEPFLSASTTHHYPLTHTLHSNSYLTQNLHTITCYAISFSRPSHFRSIISPSHCLSWWCTLFATTSFPNLREFRVDRRGHCSYYLLSPEDEIVDMSSSRVEPEIWQELERALVKGASRASLRVDVEVQGWARMVEEWKEDYFPSGNRDREGGCVYLRECFPLAHQGEIGLVLNLRIWVRLLPLRRWLQRRFAKRKSAYERGCYAYTPQQRWARVDDETVGSMAVNAIRSDFEHFLKDQNT